jgi:hypothetical protein
VSAPGRTTLAEFADADAVLGGAERLRREGFPILDALTPHPLPRLSDLVGATASPIRPVMALAGFGTALLFFALQAYSQGWAYPLNSGGRPLVSWPVYWLVPFETGVLAAALAGFLTLLWRTGLPRLHHPVFAVPGIERATQDRFFLILAAPSTELDARRLDRVLAETGVLSVSEVGP